MNNRVFGGRDRGGSWKAVALGLAQCFFLGTAVRGHQGMRPSLSLLQEAVEAFLVACRPRGKKLPERLGLN